MRAKAAISLFIVLFACVVFEGMADAQGFAWFLCESRPDYSGDYRTHNLITAYLQQPINLTTQAEVNYHWIFLLRTWRHS
jgi:hypothetical protein